MRVKQLLPGWKKSCDESNDGFACGNLGALYALGKVVPKDESQAFQYYEKACRFGQAIRCLRAGVMALNGRGLTASSLKGAELFQLGCRLLDSDACVNYYAVTHGRTILWSGDTVKMPPTLNPVKAEPGALHNVITVLTMACEQGLTKACGNLGGMIEEGDATPRDLGKALEYYTKACELGEAERCARAGRFVANGIPEPAPSREKAAKLFERHCELKKLATCPLAFRARNGLGIELTLEKAPAQPAHDSVPAVTVVAKKIGIAGESAESVRQMAQAPKNTPPWSRYPPDLAVGNEALPEELQLMMKKCNAGDGRTCGNAAALLCDESGKPKLWAETARQLLERACYLGRGQRCADLARMHKNGWGTEPSPERAKAALDRACELGHKISCATN